MMSGAEKGIMGVCVAFFSSRYESGNMRFSAALRGLGKSYICQLPGPSGVCERSWVLQEGIPENAM